MAFGKIFCKHPLHFVVQRGIDVGKPLGNIFMHCGFAYVEMRGALPYGGTAFGDIFAFGYGGFNDVLPYSAPFLHPLKGLNIDYAGFCNIMTDYGERVRGRRTAIVLRAANAAKY